jgi:hypothetical protein
VPTAQTRHHSLDPALARCRSLDAGRARAVMAGLVASALLLSLSACGLTGTGRRIVGPDGTKLPADTVKVLDIACAQDAETKTAGSIAGILRSLRPGSYQRAYNACVESKGLRVEGQSASAQPATAQSAPPASPGAKSAKSAGTPSPVQQQKPSPAR